MSTVVKSIRVKEEIWESLRKLSKEENRPLTQLLNEALEKYLADKIRKRGAEEMQKLPSLSLGKDTITREEIYEGRY